MDSKETYESKLSESAKSILNARPSYIVSYGSVLILLSLLVFSFIIFLKDYKPSSNGKLEVIKPKNEANLNFVSFTTQSPIIYEKGEKIEIRLKSSNYPSYYGVIVSIEKNNLSQIILIKLENNKYYLKNINKYANKNVNLRKEGQRFYKLLTNYKF